MIELPLSRIEHETDAQSRNDPHLLDRVSAGRLLLIRDGQVAVADDRLVTVPASTIPDSLLSWDHVSYVGIVEGAHWAALHLEPTAAALDAEGIPYGDRRITALHEHSFVSLRTIGHTLSALEAGLATTATALGAWRDSRKYCGECGGRLAPRAGGWEGICSDCGLITYPRTDPSVIMAIRDPHDRLLLGHAVNWEPTRYSCLAGFVEAGESLEHAVRRESFEEAGVVIDRVEYVGSQPWPFPRSLMAAFRAWTSSEEVEVDGVEVTTARFVTREELVADIADGRLTVPMASSVARYLIEDWFGGPLPTATPPA